MRGKKKQQRKRCNPRNNYESLRLLLLRKEEYTVDNNNKLND